MITILYKINYIGNGGTHYKTPNNGWDCGIHLYMFITPLWRCHYGYVTTLLPRQNNATMKDCKKWRLLSLISHTNDFTNKVIAINTNITTPKPSQELHSNHTSWWPYMLGNKDNVQDSFKHSFQFNNNNNEKKTEDE